MALPILVQVELQQQQHHHEQHDLNFDNLGRKALKKKVRRSIICFT